MLTFENYDEIEAYLRGFTNFGGDAVPYDFNGSVHLLLALLDNLRVHALEAELKDIGESFNDDQGAFLLKIAEHLREPGDIAPYLACSPMESNATGYCLPAEVHVISKLNHHGPTLSGSTRSIGPTD